MSRFESEKGPSQRQLRVGEQVRHALAEVQRPLLGQTGQPDGDGPVVLVKGDLARFRGTHFPEDARGGHRISQAPGSGTR